MKGSEFAADSLRKNTKVWGNETDLINTFVLLCDAAFFTFVDLLGVACTPFPVGAWRKK